MNTQSIVNGTLRPDGTLELDQRPDLAPGRVQVTVQPLAEPPLPTENWWQFMQRMRAELEASGHCFRTKEEIDAEIEELRSGDERIDAASRPAGNAPSGKRGPC